jgi:hypothetical protein
MRITQQLSGGEVLTSTTARRVRLYLWLSRVQGRLSEGRVRRTRNPRFPSTGVTASPLFDNPTTGYGNCEYQLWHTGRSDQSAAVGQKRSFQAALQVLQRSVILGPSRPAK